MEDNKNDKTQVLSNKETAIPEKPSYEQLKYWLDKAISDNKNLIAQLNVVSDILFLVGLVICHTPLLQSHILWLLFFLL